jgi:hypothetical protein
MSFKRYQPKYINISGPKRGRLNNLFISGMASSFTLLKVDSFLKSMLKYKSLPPKKTAVIIGVLIYSICFLFLETQILIHV